VKLLFDQNLSPYLAERVADLYPDSTHVYPAGLDRVSDLAVWSFARGQGFVIVTEDSDFIDLSTVPGFPPKVSWIRRVARPDKLKRSFGLINEIVVDLVEDAGSGILALF
jgi:predicted nuclease of predicted toxin-antitoxin system